VDAHDGNARVRTVVVSRAIKVVYAPDVDPKDQGDLAEGAFVVSWCCPPWEQAAPAPVPTPKPVPKPLKPVG